ncbi:hypothetical protein ACFOHK_08845 [Falsigemmobacter intermedius]|uniref:Uncharacterized protein n=1 Tax=Falsigemmobacter intermedius TaxID=1553448 RepID=A0A3S3VFW6_9RHOB|nr:hypothetical protein [Falsigemmobacter intermedius]RWY34931.1 hypothetical protein EP867_19070 [Falsigemmobacter intermedius]
MSDTVTIHNGYCSYHGPAEKAPAWAPNVLKSDVAGELRREKFQHGGKAANTRYSTPSDTQPSGRDPVHDNLDTTKTAKRVSHIFSAPLTSFEDTTHAWEEGYRAGRAEGCGQKIQQKLQRFAECADDGEDVDIGREWLDVLSTLGFLVRSQRSPARWVMTEIGERTLSAGPMGKEIW